MNEMDKIAAKKLTEKIRKLIEVVQKSEVSKSLRKGFWSPAASLGSGAASSGGEAVKNLVFGRPAAFGAMAGKRLQAVRGGPGKGLREITKTEYKAIQGGKSKGVAVSGKIGGKTHYYKRIFRHGGVVGWARKNPLWAAGIAALGYMAGTSGESRAIAKGFLPSAPRQQADPWLINQLQRQPRTGNPLHKKTWG